ncbi:hypothetical protein B0I08_101347 [Glaciihabitans tibetensis]|uniref:Tic20 family protein n=1 Tax=Glaciihabitans tibetensis TaxID=1266600 RepID=A0A2T0VJ40_9MICO|nr:DUF4870 domain-containing protein [Glaciihabitans tibetensis]PRY70219.1 hypothetical protein B0I08_101347 [Glaciihabitans tibetensis]
MSNPAPPVQPAAPLTPAEDKQWASFAHFGGVLWFLPALIIFLVYKDRGQLTRQESKEALNWQITYSIAIVALTLAISVIGTLLVLVGAFPLAQLLGYLPYLLYIVNAVFSILGGIRVNAGGAYRYPVALRLIS